MDSLELPFDLIWEGKPEPLSPADLALANAEDVLLFDQDFANDLGLMNPDNLKSERCEEDESKMQSPLEMLLELQQQALAIDNDDIDGDVVYDVVYDDGDVISDADADLWLNQSMNLLPLDGFADVVNINISPAAAAFKPANASGNFHAIFGMQQQTVPPVKIEQTAQLIREFDTVYSVVELTHLTPPQSPPRMPTPTQTGFIFPSQPNIQAALSTNHQNQNIQQQQHHNINISSNIFNTSTPAAEAAANFFLFDGAQHSIAASPMTSQDIAHEMEVVEELVRTRAEDLGDWSHEDEEDDENSQSSDNSLTLPPSPSMSTSPSSSPSSSSSSSSSSSCSSSAACSPRSDSSSPFDVDWTPSATNASIAGITNNGIAKTEQQQRRPRPYGRSTEDKKCRKKEQNKNAATRYRQKKKAEVEVALDEERDLLDVHAGLRVRCADVQREIKYLKSLMRDLYRAKTLQ